MNMLYVTPRWNIAKGNEMLRYKTVHLKCADVASLYKVILMSQFFAVDLITISTGSLLTTSRCRWR